MKRSEAWTARQLQAYYQGLEHSDYPQVFWEKIRRKAAPAATLADIGCGPGAFALKALDEGFFVQAVDSSRQHLLALEGRAGEGKKEKLKLIAADWLEARIMSSEITVCAYSLGGNIGSPAGIKKTLMVTTKKAFFITPWKKRQYEFLSEGLYREMGVMPEAYEKSGADLLAIFSSLGEEVEVEIVDFDFGIPLKATGDERRETALFLCEKLGLPSLDLMLKHIDAIASTRAGLPWLPNPKRAAFITWTRSDSN